MLSLSSYNRVWEIQKIIISFPEFLGFAFANFYMNILDKLRPRVIKWRCILIENPEGHYYGLLSDLNLISIKSQ